MTDKGWALEAAPRQYEFAVAADRGALESLGLEWEALFERAGAPHQAFQSFRWLSLWADHYCDQATTLSVVTARRNGRLVLVWPLVLRRRWGLRLLSFMGEPLSQYGDALVEPGADAALMTAEAVDFVRTFPFDVASLKRVRDDAALAGALARAAERTSAQAQAPFVDFAGAANAAAFEKRSSAKLRSDRRRRLRRLQEIGAVAFESHAPGPRARELAEIAFAFKQEWLRGTGRIAPALADPRFGGFFAAAAAGGSGAPELRVSALTCAGETIGVEISLACKGRLIGHVLAPKPGFEKQGVGAILAAQAIIGALSKAMAPMIFWPPPTLTKMEWASGCVGVRDFALVRTARGRLYKRLWLNFGRQMLKSLADRLRRLRPRR